MTAALQADPLGGFRLDGKVAWVTGASSGLGDRSARVLHAAGAHVVVAARRQERLDALVAALPGALAVAAGLGEEAGREDFMAHASSGAAPSTCWSTTPGSGTRWRWRTRMS